MRKRGCKEGTTAQLGRLLHNGLFINEPTVASAHANQGLAMRFTKLALLGALSLTAVGFGSAAEAQGPYGGPGYVRVSRPLPIRIRPRSWLDAGRTTEAYNGSVSNPATSPYLIQASNLLSPVYGRNDLYGGSNLPDPITNGPFIGARSTAIRNVDFSAIDVIDPTSYRSRTGMSPY
ncbi:hypothetical protein MGN01_39290 [Methylobacterium gnaphalii]|uniref:Uncharacterized protein n=2 Tax=Methylobacterium gnaphalii TaxID=1010610 RepID=A0A512JQ41_9HYPH|nr:hypothetical protein MGN01_39290 [Methylobacterium gnaphalii]GLS48201.1 hypothetical protein GCM10007885_10450 [Methylobacterium gnaphalii]